MRDRFCIVIAWFDTIDEYDGNAYAADLGQRAGVTTRIIAVAAVWLLDGSTDDFDRAKEYADEMTPKGKVFAFDVKIEDPLGAAKKRLEKEKA